MSNAIAPASLVVWGGFAIGFVFGAVANKTNFCTMGAISVSYTHLTLPTIYPV